MSVFTVCERGESPDTPRGGDFWFELQRSDWDDYGYRTTFQLVRHSLDGKRIEIGYVKIMRAGMGYGSIELNRNFDVLPADYASLGQTLDYYRNVRKLRSHERITLLEGLRDEPLGNSALSGLGEGPSSRVA